MDNLGEWLKFGIVVITVLGLMFAMANSFDQLDEMRREDERK